MDIGILGCGTLGRALAQGLRTNPRVNRAATRTGGLKRFHVGIPRQNASCTSRRFTTTRNKLALDRTFLKPRVVSPGKPHRAHQALNQKSLVCCLLLQAAECKSTPTEDARGRTPPPAGG